MKIPPYKDIAELINKGVSQEAREKIMELREAAIELQEENLLLREKVAGLEGQLNKSKDLKLSGGIYWLLEDSTPFCQVCYDKDKKLIHLQNAKKNWRRDWRCPVCLFLYGNEYQ